MERGIKARVYPATIDGTASGEPVLMSRETLAKKRVEMAGTFNSQMLQNPSPNEDAYFKKEWFRWYDDDAQASRQVWRLGLRGDGQGRRLHRPCRCRCRPRRQHLHSGIGASRRRQTYGSTK